MRFEVRHQDHGVTFEQLLYVCDQLEKTLAKPGKFTLRVKLPPELGTIQNGLHGPVCGDEPIEDEDVVFWTRPPRAYADRCVDRPFRQVDYVHTFGELDKSGFCMIETIFGGPLALRHPEDPKCEDVVASKLFWTEHALSIPPEKDR